MSPEPHAQIGLFEGQAAVTLSVGDMSATIVPGLGLLGASITRAGDEFLSLAAGLDGYAKGHTTGLPLLAPWANRLAGDTYRIGGVTVDVADAPHVKRDANGRPMHGTLGADSGWELVRIAADARSAAMVSRLDLRERPDLLESFPFPHLLVVEHRVDHSGLSVSTTLRATGRRRVPVAFGWHPYFRLPASRRNALRLVLPARRHLELDEGGIPTGAGQQVAAESEPLGSRTFDDLYALGRDRRVGLESGGRSLRVLLDRNYGYLQVYAPEGENFCALEPMTAPTNALTTGTCPFVSPGQSFTARFSIIVT